MSFNDMVSIPTSGMEIDTNLGIIASVKGESLPPVSGSLVFSGSDVDVNCGRRTKCQGSIPVFVTGKMGFRGHYQAFQRSMYLSSSSQCYITALRSILIIYHQHYAQSHPVTPSHRTPPKYLALSHSTFRHLGMLFAGKSELCSVHRDRVWRDLTLPAGLKPSYAPQVGRAPLFERRWEFLSGHWHASGSPSQNHVNCLHRHCS